MPIGIVEWRAGITRNECCFKLRAHMSAPSFELSSAGVCSLAYMRLFIFISILILHCNALVIFVGSSMVCSSLNLPKITTYLLVRCSGYCRNVLVLLQLSLYALLINELVGYLTKSSYKRALLLTAGDIESNPGPRTTNCLNFFHRNLNSMYVRERIKIPSM